MSRFSISLEGLDGAGKSTAVKSLVKHYDSLGYKTTSLVSPSKRPSGLFLRHNLFNMSDEEKELAFVADLKDSQASIDPTTQLAVWDRHIDSIYTSNRNSNIGRIGILAAGIELPNITFYLKLEVDEAYDRAAPITDHPLDKTWLKMKFDRYDELVQASPDRFAVIDASRPATEVLNDIVSKTNERML